MEFDTGIGWVHRWFAKPLVAGSIPARVSIFRPLYNQPLWGRGHRYQLGQALGYWLGRKLSGSQIFSGVLHHRERPPLVKRFPNDYSGPDLVRLAEYHHAEHRRLATEAANLRDRLIEAQKQLSDLKRGKA